MKIKFEKYIVYFALIVAVLYGWFFYRPNQQEQKAEYATVQRVIDGDTILLNDGRKVRYIGIDTPESVKEGTEIECYSKEASEANKKLVEGKQVKLVKDVSDKDKYERLLRYVYIDDVFVNEYLLKNGYATIMSIAPDISKYAQFKLIQQEAKKNNLGLWKDCKK